MTDVIRLEAVTKQYDETGPAALSGVGLAVGAHEAVAVMGPSGSGKSTLLNLIAGLDRASSGDVTVAGVRLNGLSETALARFRRQHIGMVFQFFNLLDDLTVLDNVLMPARLGGMSLRTARTRSAELLDYLGIGRHADAYPARLSGGERQRVAIARALMNRPPLLLADEPTGAVDSATGRHITDLLAELNRDGQALLLVTHDERLAQECTGRIVRIVDGRIVGEEATTGRAAAAANGSGTAPAAASPEAAR
ncbi:ABC transporter ATP-binding protein [Yinghuangia soli]|uniref:ABC transporter ATP-binding protein n=1 Tax=Yinghuangia soli TaxID=2908204 RepID=A0AA41Q5I5_9ACTN|nr:ABC transporter ATP-binding protein [Yinghuangia soli]MCF2531622.1 ABC transporter ATP-binding protein [Yinghuangia soli]